MHTEDEAKKKWCPHVQVSVSTGIDGTEADDNRNSTTHDFDRQPVCIGSACMAWCWAKVINPEHQPHDGMWPDKRAPNEKELYIDGRDKGFCGLSGAHHPTLKARIER